MTDENSTLPNPRWNLGRGREISDEHPKFHISVQERMKDPKLGYKPKAIWKEGSEVYVD